MAGTDKVFQTSSEINAESEETPLKKVFDPAEIKNNMFYEERARALARQSKFYEATSWIEMIEQHKDDDDQLGLNLLKAECYIQLGRENKADKSIEAVKGVLLSSPELDVDLLVSLAKSMGNDQSFISSVILLRIASLMYKNWFPIANEQVDGISQCIRIARDILASVTQKERDGHDDEENGGETSVVTSRKATKPADPARHRVIVLDFGIEYMKEMLDELRLIEGANIEIMTIKQAWAAIQIGYVLANVHEFDKSYKILEHGIEAMDSVYGDHAGYHRVYGVLLHNKGTLLHNSNKYAEAIDVYERTIVAKEMAVDYDGTEKQLDIESTRKFLDISRRHLQLA